MDYLKEDFASVDATLTPDPFDSVFEEDANTTFRYDATGGFAGGGGAAVTWAGTPPTADSAYGTVLLAGKNPPIILASKQNRPTHLRISFSLAIPTVTGFTTNDRVKVLAVMGNDATGAEIELFSISWVKTASNYKWRVDSFDGASTTGSNFNPTSFAYSTHQGWVVDAIMKDGVGFVNIGTIWGWANQGTAGASVQHSFGTTSFFTRATSVTHFPTKVLFGSVSCTAVPSAASEFNFDDIAIVDNLFDNPGFITPYEGNFEYLRDNASNGLKPMMPRSPEYGCSFDMDYAQVGLPFQKYAVFGSVPSTNIALNHTKPSTQIAIDENAMYMISMTMVESTMPNADNPATRNDRDAGKGNILGRGYTQIYTQRHNVNSTALPSVPYWGMNQVINNRHYIVVPPGHNSLILYNGEFVEMEVYVHRIRFPF